MANYSNLSAEIADRLLDKLATDDAFRAAFRADPAAALGTLGYSRPTEEAAATLDPFSACVVQDLASKEAILAAREQLKKALMVGTSYNSPLLEAGSVATRTLK
ncbi:MAG TPA: NHLP-related RiPP peptide [Stenotrophomonas sp.]|nr:NHLP-related RiPP peptide [Stenotrophomonas sp.]